MMLLYAFIRLLIALAGIMAAVCVAVAVAAVILVTLPVALAGRWIHVRSTR